VGEQHDKEAYTYRMPTIHLIEVRLLCPACFDVIRVCAGQVSTPRWNNESHTVGMSLKVGLN